MIKVKIKKSNIRYLRMNEVYVTAFKNTVARLRGDCILSSVGYP
jgi:hypothetical protein